MTTLHLSHMCNSLAATPSGRCCWIAILALAVRDLLTSTGWQLTLHQRFLLSVVDCTAKPAFADLVHCVTTGQSSLADTACGFGEGGDNGVSFGDCFACVHD